MDLKIKEHIQTADWPTITRKLAIYASFRVTKIFCGARGDCVLPMGFSVNAIVQESIEKLLNGTRKWDPEKIDLLTFLKGVVKSETSHLVELKENTLTDRTKVLEEYTDIQSVGLNPEQSLIEKGRKELLEAVHRKLIQQAESNPEYESVALCIMEGFFKPADIAMETGINIDRVYFLKKHWQKDYDKILREVLAEAN